MNCIFCHKEQIATDFVYEDEWVMALKNVYKPNGYSIMQNGGAFNDVGHYHLHIFPRYTGDGFGWTNGNSNKDVNTEIAKKIRDKLKFNFGF